MILNVKDDLFSPYSCQILYLVMTFEHLKNSTNQIIILPVSYGLNILNFKPHVNF